MGLGPAGRRGGGEGRGKRGMEGLARELRVSTTRARAASAAAPRRSRARVRRRLPTREKLPWRLCTTSPLPGAPPPRFASPSSLSFCWSRRARECHGSPASPGPGLPSRGQLAAERPPCSRRAHRREGRTVRVSQPHAAPTHPHTPQPTTVCGSHPPAHPPRRRPIPVLDGRHRCRHSCRRCRRCQRRAAKRRHELRAAQHRAALLMPTRAGGGWDC